MAEILNQEDAARELENALGQTEETVAVAKQQVTVRPLRLRQFASALKCVQRLRAAGVIEDKAFKDVAEGEDAAEVVKRFDMAKMFLDGFDEIINIINIAVSLPPRTVDNLDLLEGARLASAIFKVNLDFFYQNREAIRAALAPAVEAVEQVMNGGLETLGQPPLTASEEQVTR